MLNDIRPFRDTAAYLSLFAPNSLIISFPIFCQSLYLYDLHFCVEAVSLLYPVYYIVNRFIILYGPKKLRSS